MKYLSTVASLVACVATAHSQCTFTASPCQTIIGPTETITVYEQPFLSTSTVSYDCQGCSAVTVVPRNCGVGPVIETTTFVYENAQSTTTVDVCSPTP